MPHLREPLSLTEVEAVLALPNLAEPYEKPGSECTLSLRRGCTRNPVRHACVRRLPQ